MRQLKIATQITNRDSQAVEKYLQEISKISMITPEEETTLAQRIKMGDQRALDKLVQANLRFVVSVAKQYQHQGLSLSDLINEGNLGLIKAAQRFDETKGFKFISYAVWWIRQSILQALAEQGRLVRLPQNKIGTYNKANKAYMAFEQEHEREPSTEELAEILEMSEFILKWYPVILAFICMLYSISLGLLGRHEEALYSAHWPGTILLFALVIRQRRTT